MSERQTPSRIGRIEWVIYHGILTATFLAVVILTGNMIAALIATAGAVLSATHAAAMMNRAYGGGQ